MKPSESLYLQVRELRYHCRRWGDPAQPTLFMLHGWMDVSASFQFLVDALRRDWHVVAPDWRGYGLTEWARTRCYWFPDYFADLEALLAHFQPAGTVTLVGHSMGGNIACMYAGIRPQRVARIVNLEGFGLSAGNPAQAPRRYARWLDELRGPAPSFRDYDSFDALAARLRAGNERLSEDRAQFLARHWGRAAPEGRVRLASDPAHKLVNPVLYRLEEAQACWRSVTAPVLWVAGAHSQTPGMLKLGAEELDARKACFRDLRECVIPDAGHMVHHDQPERLAVEMEAFLSRSS